MSQIQKNIMWIVLTGFFTGLLSNCLMDTAPGTGVGSCQITMENTCYDYTGSAYDPVSGRSGCEGNGGIYSSGKCPASDSSGPCYASCIVYSGMSTQMTVRIYQGYPQGSVFCSIMGGKYSTSCN